MWSSTPAMKASAKGLAWEAVRHLADHLAAEDRPIGGGEARGGGSGHLDLQHAILRFHRFGLQAGLVEGIGEIGREARRHPQGLHSSGA
jgi:hypothetical protein